MLVSVLWSDQLSVSFKRWVREILAPVIMSFIMLSENNSREAMFSVLRRTIYILIPFSLCLVRYFPLYGVQHGVWFGEIMWVGVTTQKNSLGRLCIIAIFYLTWSLIKKLLNRNIPAVKYQTAAEIILLIISCHLLIGPSIMAMSATSLAVLSIVLTIFILLLIGNKYKLYPSANILTILLAAGIILGVATLFTAGKAVGSFTPMLGRDATLTGRTDMWAVLLPKAMERAFLGHGYGGFWTQAWVDFFGANETHNGYLGILLDQGIIGLILMVLFLLTSCRKAQRLLENDFYWASLWIGFLFMSVFHNTAETSLNSFSSNLTLLLVFMSVSISSYNRYLPTEVRHEQNET
jgi:O-antigen ligase